MELSFTIKGIRLIKGEKGSFISMPRYKTKDDGKEVLLFVSMPQYRTTDEGGREQWKFLVYPHNKNMYEWLTRQVLEEYNRGSKEREQQGKDIPKNRGKTTR